MASDNKKKKKNMKASKKGVIITTLVITVLALSAIAYIVYFTGVIPKTATGMEVVKTAPEGTTTRVEKISVLEMNYHKRQVMQSLGVSDEMWDQVLDTATGKTYGDYVLDYAADEIKNCVLVNNAAEAAGYDDHGGAKRYAESMLDSATMYAQYAKITNDQYLTSVYGTGMTSRLFIKYTERMALTSEYEAYVQQFVNAPSNDDIMATFNENPGSFQQADFSYKFFPINEDEGYDKDAAQKDADKVIATLDAADELTAEVFADAVIDVVGEDAPELKGQAEGDIAYYYQNYSKSMGYISEIVNDFVFDKENEPGKYTTVASENGVYVIYVIDKHTDDTATVTYRTCTLYLAANGGDYQAALDKANAFVANPTDALGFDAYIKQNTVYPNEILTGGYYEGITEDSFQGDEDHPAADIDTAIGAWLFDSARKEGDMKVFTSADQSTVRIVFFEANTPKWMQICRSQARALLTQQWRAEIIPEDVSYVVYPDTISRFTY